MTKAGLRNIKLSKQVGGCFQTSVHLKRKICADNCTAIACGVKYPTDVLPWPLTVTQYTPPGSIYQNTTTPFCLSGNQITVKSGDSCQSIAEANSVNTGTLRIINNIFPDCTNLVVSSSL